MRKDEQGGCPTITLGDRIAKGIFHGLAGPDKLHCVVKEVQANELRILTELHEYRDRHGAEHIITCFPQWTERRPNGDFLLPLEYCDHGHLESVLLLGYDGRHLTYEERKQILHGIVKGLSLMHSLGYVHRDLKPSNVLFGSQRTASKLADLGIASKAGHDCDSQGSCGYLPPESREGEHAAQFTRDIFSLGILAYQLLATRGGARMLPHPYDSAQTCGDNPYRALNLHGNIKQFKLSSDWLTPISIHDELAANLIESMLQRDPCKRPTVHAVLAHPFFWTAAEQDQRVSAFLRRPNGDHQLMGRIFSRLAGQDPRAPALTDPSNAYLPLCMETLQDFLDTNAKGSPCDDSPSCTSACCQLFMSKHGDTDPGTLGGCSLCMARIDHFCNRISYDNVRILQDPDKEILGPTGNESWYTLHLERESSPDYEVFLNGSIGGPGNERTVNVYTIDPSIAAAEGDQLEFVVARCWVTLFGARHESSIPLPGAEGYCRPEGILSHDGSGPELHRLRYPVEALPMDQQTAPLSSQPEATSTPADLQAAAQEAFKEAYFGLRYPAEVLPADQQAFKIIPFRYTRGTQYICKTRCTRKTRKSPCPAHIHCFASLTSPLSTSKWARESCADLFYHQPLQLCSGCANLEEHICTKHSHEGSVKLDLLKDVPGASARICNVHTDSRITYDLPQHQAHFQFVFVMRNDPVGPPSASKLCRVPLPTNPAQATCLFGPYCCYPLSCPMAHPVSLTKCGGLDSDSDACLSSSLEDGMAQVHPELCSDCSKLYETAGPKDAVPNKRNANKSHYCNRRNYHGFIVERASKGSAGSTKTLYQIWHLREDEDPFDEAKPRFNVYGLIKVERCKCQEPWQQKLQCKAKELQVKPEDVPEEIKHDLREEVCRGCRKAGDHWTDVADRIFVGYDHLPGMLHLSTMNPDQKKKALKSNKGKQKSAAEAGLRAGFEGQHLEFVVAVQQCDVKLGGPAKAKLVALPYSRFSTDMCLEGSGCPKGLACRKIHSPAGNATASSTPAPALAVHAPFKPTMADIAKAKAKQAAPQGPSGINLHEFPQLSQTAPGITTRCGSHSHSCRNAWQCEEPRGEVTAGKSVAERSAQGAAAPLATPGGTKGRKKGKKVPLCEFKKD